MRRFSSYGQIDTEQNYYAPRQELIAHAYTQLMGDDPERGGHYITVWAPRQTGKSWVMQQILFRLRADERYDVLKISLEHLKLETDVNSIVQAIAKEILEGLQKTPFPVNSLKEFETIFKHGVLDKPFVLILDEFDALSEPAISGLVSIFRKIYLHRQDDPRPSAEKEYLLHGVALIGVRSVLGIENVRGSPFNVQRSLHVPNLTFAEVEGMFQWYARESGQPVEPDVIERLYYETNGQPGLTCWFGELLTEGFEDYQPSREHPLTMDEFNYMLMWATKALPNSNILNLISKAKQEPYRQLVLELFKTEEKIVFRYDEPALNFLYMNGVIGIEHTPQELYAQFPCPLVQRRLFNYFSDELFRYTGKVRELADDLSNILTPAGLDVKNLMKRFEIYLQQNRDWLLKDAPKRKDLRIYEAVYHFCFYRYLTDFFDPEGAHVSPEFPTGNGKIDLLITYQGTRYGLELKSFRNEREYYAALEQAAKYGKTCALSEIWLIAFVEYVDAATRQKYAQEYVDKTTGVKVRPVFVETGR